jgi:thiosulfate/3-mercaptopyruvate sulfurtransferase
LEVWEKVLIDADAMAGDVHGEIRCTDCHGGSNVDDKAAAHEGLVRDPSDSPTGICGTCHTDIQAAQVNSLHMTLAGYDTSLYARSVPENHPALEEMQANHCNSCHASCGQCHISQPNSAGGGLLEGHVVVERPPMSRTCTGCHGSRVRNEYTGRNEGFPGDVHFTQARFNCADCHTGDEMHGVTGGVDSRYSGERVPTCESCHPDSALTSGGGALYHSTHIGTLACQVCHSVSYKSCSGCHVQQSETGTPFFQLDQSWMDFRIGLNAEPDEDRPWEYVLVRHVPIDPESFAFYGENLLPNFDARPTWMEATPHNIQRNTPQAASCDACHGNASLFLTAGAVSPEELLANQAVIVPQVPELP